MPMAFAACAAKAITVFMELSGGGKRSVLVVLGLDTLLEYHVVKVNGLKIDYLAGIGIGLAFGRSGSFFGGSC